MASLFGSRPQGPSEEQQRAQRRQAQAVDQQTAEQSRQRGERSRIRRASRQGSSLFGQAGAAGVRQTLG